MQNHYKTMPQEIFISFSQSLDRFSEILQEEKTIANRDSAIKRFELTFELAWKALKTHLAERGIVCRSPRDCLQEAFKLGLIPDNPLWFKMIDDCNESVHTYNENLAEAMYKRLPGYLDLFKELKGLFEES